MSARGLQFALPIMQWGESCLYHHHRRDFDAFAQVRSVLCRKLCRASQKKTFDTNGLGCGNSYRVLWACCESLWPCSQEGHRRRGRRDRSGLSVVGYVDTFFFNVANSLAGDRSECCFSIMAKRISASPSVIESRRFQSSLPFYMRGWPTAAFISAPT